MASSRNNALEFSSAGSVLATNSDVTQQVALGQYNSFRILPLVAEVTSTATNVLALLLAERHLVLEQLSIRSIFTTVTVTVD